MAGQSGGAAGCDPYAGQGRRVAVGTTVRPAATGGGGRRERKKKFTPDAAMAPKGERRCASGARLVADWPPLLPPCVKTQMACCGWSEAPVS